MYYIVCVFRSIEAYHASFKPKGFMPSTILVGISVTVGLLAPSFQCSYATKPSLPPPSLVVNHRYNPVLDKHVAEYQDDKRGGNEGTQNGEDGEAIRRTDWKASLSTRVFVASPTCMAVRTMAIYTSGSDVVWWRCKWLKFAVDLVVAIDYLVPGESRSPRSHRQLLPLDH